MKIIKISLAIIVVAAIAFFVMRSCVTVYKPPEIPPSGNRIIDIIQQEINALQQKPDNKFCKVYYNEVAYHIDDYYKDGRLGKSTSENIQWKESLSKQLYAAYADKFIKQAYYIFNRSDWANSDLDFIRSEYQALQSSPILERTNPIHKKFNEIETILNKYDEITGFISVCKRFLYPETSLGKQYPLDDMRSKISTARSYQANDLENSYVNNCTRLHNGLNEIPQDLFRAHVSYLDKMIDSWAGKFTGYNTQKNYVDNLYSPLENKINELDNDIYNVSDFDSVSKRLKQKWIADADNAYKHFNPYP